MSSLNCSSSSCAVMPHRPSHSSSIEMLLRWFMVENIDICENFVMPVMNRKRMCSAILLTGP